MKTWPAVLARLRVSAGSKFTVPDWGLTKDFMIQTGDIQ